MIDYEITVNVSNLTYEEKKRVQDAFFKLGFAWRWSGTDYACLNKGCYTNTFRGGKVTQDLMWADASTKPTHTVDQLLELAGMKTKADLKPFDLEKALAGEPVVLRDGTKAYIRHHETQVKTSYPLIGYVADGKAEGNIMSWTEDGRVFWDREGSVGDIDGMWSEPLVFKHWDLLKEDIKFLAKDWGELWFGYKSKPTISEDKRWDAPQGGCYNLTSLKPDAFPECSWENSLIERPKKQRGEV